MKEYLEDPLVWKGKVRARVGTELLNAAVYNLEHAKDFRVRRGYTCFTVLTNTRCLQTPFLLCQGQKDLIVDHTKAQVFFDKCGEEDKQIIYFKESMHEILFDIENQVRPTLN